MMLTRCPACDTAFRVTPEQLKLRAGRVRCGHCQAVFNALETLADAAPAPALPETEPAAGNAAEGDAASSAPPDPATQTPDALGDSFGVFDRPERRPRRLAWSAGIVLMLALGILQGAYAFRTELAAAQPGLRPLLEDLCAALDCDLPLPRKADLVGIEVSDLHPEPQQAHLLALSATLKNRAGFAQAYPALELTLTDTRDQPLVRRVLGPDDYLPPGTDARAGFAANSDLAVSVWIDASGVAATGYRLYLFYP